MEYHILALGDVTSETGVRHLARRLRELKRLCGIDFTVVNGENISGVGLTPEQAEDLFAAGADVITLGNHTWGRMQIADYLDDCPYILRPANFTNRVPGRGWGMYDCGRVQIGVMNLIGRCDLDFHAENPFTTAFSPAARSPRSRSWTSTPRPRAKSSPSATISTGACPPSGGRTPMSQPPTSA